jgi:hypothetical protein
MFGCVTRRRGASIATAFAAVVALRAPPARAANEPSLAALIASATANPAAPAPAGQGLAVVALPGATEAAWPLALAVYGQSALRPSHLDDATARALCGEAPPTGAPAELADLAAAVAALRGDDAPSRILLGEIAHRAQSRALVTVQLINGRPVARVFLPETGAFDAATYAPDATGSGVPSPAPSIGAMPPEPSTAWSGAVASLVRVFGASPAAAVPVAAPPGPGAAIPASPPPAIATHEAPAGPRPAPTRSQPFYESFWFWGALGAAALAGGGLYFATRDTSASTIHLEVQVH